MIPNQNNTDMNNIDAYNDLTFDIEQPGEILECYKKYGIVCIRNVIDITEVKKTQDDINNIIQNKFNDKFDLNDPYTYNLITSQHTNRFGVLGDNFTFTPQLISNTLHPNVKRAYEIIYQLPANKLLVQFGTVSWMRPTLGPCHEDWSHFRTPYEGLGLHLDINPITYFDNTYYKEVLDFSKKIDFKNLNDLGQGVPMHQKAGNRCFGILNLFQNKEYNEEGVDDGGLHVALGGHNILEEWNNNAKKYYDTSDTSILGRYNFKNKISDKVFSRTTRIPSDPGTLILFDVKLPHGTKPNKGMNNRMIQFIRYSPRELYEPTALKNYDNILHKIYGD